MKKLFVKTTAMLIAFMIFAAGAFAEPITFYDMGSHEWALRSVIKLANEGIINGTAPHVYSPAEYVSRGQVCELLCRMFGTTVTGLEAFDDVAKDSYYYNSIASLKALGILKDDGKGRFFPDAPATRETTFRLMGFMLIRMTDDSLQNISLLDAFPDGQTVEEQNKEYAAAVISRGFIVGDNCGYLNPKSNLTRAEAAVILDRMYTYLNGSGNN